MIGNEGDGEEEDEDTIQTTQHTSTTSRSRDVCMQKTQQKKTIQQKNWWIILLIVLNVLGVYIIHPVFMFLWVGLCLLPLKCRDNSIGEDVSDDAEIYNRTSCICM